MHVQSCCFVTKPFAFLTFLYLPYESDEGSCSTFLGGIKVFKPYMIIQYYAFMYFQNSQGGRS